MNDAFDASELLLAVPEKSDPERELVADAWTRHGGDVLRLGRFWSPPPLRREGVRIYGPDTFALVFAQVAGLELLSPPDDWIVRLPDEWLGRRLRLAPLGSVSEVAYPLFVKPLTPKLFQARIYQSTEALVAECRGLSPEEPVVVSDPVEIRAEVRAFLLAGRVLARAVYEGASDPRDADKLLRDVARHPRLPAACVVDVALLATGRWVVIEANAAWGAGLNGCDATAVLPAIAAATSYLADGPPASPRVPGE